MKKKDQCFDIVLCKRIQQELDKAEEHISVKTLELVEMQVAVEDIFYFCFVKVIC